MLTDQMKHLIQNHSAGLVATVNSDGSPSVSPKGTFAILNDRMIAFGNIRSPRTMSNLRRNSRVEICFIDVVERKAVRISGEGAIIPKSNAPEELVTAFEVRWAEYLPRTSAFVTIDIAAAEMILSPAYDLGYSEDDLRQANLARLNALE